MPQKNISVGHISFQGLIKTESDSFDKGLESEYNKLSLYTYTIYFINVFRQH